ncbi:DUF1648 domain-containing protein [Bacillus sp. PS06]|uniref:DUF1648 domain-containing protein n=1 Tax=Bacillus sp. PS06 TaxID=2764176 RepID=UPI00177E6DEA|nr:DUF5808 domain-containing protein [Bacillus sp. PS06]MBD8067825.1 DUF1648 domain-containing protein [Bacillus sp. PS06]
MEFIIMLITILFVSVFQIFIPFFVKRSVVFGVTIPYEQAKHPQIMQYKKRYAAITSIIALISIGGFFLWNQVGAVDERQLALTGMMLLICTILIGFLLYLYFHTKMFQLKNKQNWFGKVKQVHYTELSIRSKDEMLSSIVHLIPVVISVGIIFLTAISYDQLPGKIPTHWGPDGIADAFSDKSWIVALNLPLVLIIMQLMFFFINYFTKRSGIKINAGNVTSSKLRQLRLRKYTSWFLFIVNILITLLFSVLQLNLLYENIINQLVLIIVPIGFLVIVLAGSIWLAIKVGSVDSDFEGKNIIDVTQSGHLQVEGVDEDQYWKAGVFYFNRNDSSVFVEKRFGIGYTINFANPIAYLVIVVPVVLMIIVPFFL